RVVSQAYSRVALAGPRHAAPGPLGSRHGVRAGSDVAPAQSVEARLLFEALRDAGVTDVVAVPDTHQRTLIELLLAHEIPRFVQCTTEDEAMAIAAGLIVGGRRPILQIQHAGLYACVNNLRGVGLDGELPLVLLIGLLGRDPSRAPSASFDSLVRYT